MANEENLVPFNKRTESEQREIARKGGVASGKARQRSKTIKEELIYLLNHNDTRERLCLKLMEKAEAGDIKAFETITKIVKTEGQGFWEDMI